MRTLIYHNICPEYDSVEAVMLISTTPKHEVEQAYERLMNPPANGEEGIKLLYVSVIFYTDGGRCAK